MRKRLLVLFSVGAMALAGSAPTAFAADLSPSLAPGSKLISTSVSCDSNTPVTCTEVITAAVGKKVYTVTIVFVDNDSSGTLSLGDTILSISSTY